jgi:hypothetical protein
MIKLLKNILKVNNFNINSIRIVFCSYFYLVQSPFGHIFQQITDLILVYKKTNTQIMIKHYTKDVYDYILKFFENLKHLSIIEAYPRYYPPLTFRNSSFTLFSSLTLSKLSVRIISYEDCLALLDGRLKQLTSFTVAINVMQHYSSNLYHMVSLRVLHL